MVCVTCLLGGCAGFGDVQQFRDQAAVLRDDMAREREAWERAAAEAPLTSEARAQAEEGAAQARAGEHAADAAVHGADALMDDPIGVVVGAVAPWVPEPARTPLVLAGALVAAVVRGQKLKAGLRSVARGIDKAMQGDPEFAAGFRRNAHTFRTIQTPTAQRVVDQTQKDSKL